MELAKGGFVQGKNLRAVVATGGFMFPSENVYPFRSAHVRDMWREYNGNDD